MWFTWARAIQFAERRVIGSQRPGNFLFAYVFFVGMTFHTKTLTIRSLDPTAISKDFPTPIPP